MLAHLKTQRIVEPCKNVTSRRVRHLVSLTKMYRWPEHQGGGRGVGGEGGGECQLALSW